MIAIIENGQSEDGTVRTRGGTAPYRAAEIPGTIYLIGGSVRCGKSTLARRVRRAQLDAQVISQDAALQGLRSITTPESHPDIFEKSTDPIARDDPPRNELRLRRRDVVEWAFIKTYLAALKYSHDDALNEGCLWPSMLSELDQSTERSLFRIHHQTMPSD